MRLRASCSSGLSLITWGSSTLLSLSPFPSLSLHEVSVLLFPGISDFKYGIGFVHFFFNFRDLHLAYSVASKLNAGNVYVNTFNDTSKYVVEFLFH